MIIPDKKKKFKQENFRTYSDLRSWMQENQFKNLGYVMEEPWKEFFIEKWEKDNLIAFSMNITDLHDFTHLPIELMEKPYQVDIAYKS